MEKNIFDHEHNFGHVLGRTARAMLNLMQKMITQAGHDITVEQWTLLINIRNGRGQCQQQIARTVYRDKTTVARLADSLEKKGLIERSCDDSDRRHKRVLITAKGILLLQQLKPLALASQQKALRGIDAQQLGGCQDVLMRIYDNILE